jgi:hypothetical protein
MIDRSTTISTNITTANSNNNNDYAEVLALQTSIGLYVQEAHHAIYLVGVTNIS